MKSIANSNTDEILKNIDRDYREMTYILIFSAAVALLIGLLIGCLIGTDQSRKQFIKDISRNGYDYVPAHVEYRDSASVTVDALIVPSSGHGSIAAK